MESYTRSVQEHLACDPHGLCTSVPDATTPGTISGPGDTVGNFDAIGPGTRSGLDTIVPYACDLYADKQRAAVVELGVELVLTPTGLEAV